MATTTDLVSISDKDIQSRILTIRGVQVMLDRDLAEAYQVPTKRLNEQVKRNADRFPEPYMFPLTKDEMNELVANCDRFASMKHVGASLNHLGKKCFAFSKMGAENIPDIMARVP